MRGTARRDIAQSVFDAIGQRTLWVADKPGTSSRLKLALNAFVFALTHGTAETLAIAKALGVDPALVVEAVTGGPLDSGYFQGKAATILKKAINIGHPPIGANTIGVQSIIQME